MKQTEDCQNKMQWLWIDSNITILYNSDQSQTISYLCFKLKQQLDPFWTDFLLASEDSFRQVRSSCTSLTQFFFFFRVVHSWSLMSKQHAWTKWSTAHKSQYTYATYRNFLNVLQQTGARAMISLEQPLLLVGKAVMTAATMGTV